MTRHSLTASAAAWAVFTLFLVLVAWSIWHELEPFRDPLLQKAEAAKRAIQPGMSIRDVYYVTRPLQDRGSKDGLLVAACARSGEDWFFAMHDDGDGYGITFFRTLMGKRQHEVTEFREPQSALEYLSKMRRDASCRQLKLGFGIWAIDVQLDDKGNVASVEDVHYQG